MRELHRFDSQTDAETLADVLKARSMPAAVESEEGQWVVWIQNDDDREKARDVLLRWQQNPQAPEYQTARKDALQAAAAQEREARSRARRQVHIQDRWNGVWWKCYPLTYVMIAISVLVVMITTDWNGETSQSGGFRVPRTCNQEDSWLLEQLFILPPDVWFEAGKGWSALRALWVECREGGLWRPITPIFMHFNLFHIFFNMSWLRSLGAGIEFVRGTRRFAALVLIIAVASNITQLVWAGPAFLGMSGVVYGLIGYLWMKGRTQPWLGLALTSNQIVYSIMFLLLCMGGAFGAIANGAHLGGLVTGMLIGGRQALWRKIRSGQR